MKEESEKLKQEAEALRQQKQQADQEREACNRAFSAFDQGRKAGDTDTAIASYKEGLSLCPNDDVAHNELGEIYLRLGRKAEAVAEFQEALHINPTFSRAQTNLDAVR
ncbi:MAG: tetratricopeptide repeat protein [Deltaproteobacteria bacterium]|nr:tetratricopeptide repeat protein [Deltaproteobacteria bacterium]